MEMSDVIQHLLQKVLNDQVSKALSGIVDRASDALKEIEGLGDEQRLQAGSLILLMVEKATSDFNQKMNARLEKAKQQQQQV